MISVPWSSKNKPSSPSVFLLSPSMRATKPNHVKKCSCSRNKTNYSLRGKTCHSMHIHFQTWQLWKTLRKSWSPLSVRLKPVQINSHLIWATRLTSNARAKRPSYWTIINHRPETRRQTQKLRSFPSSKQHLWWISQTRTMRQKSINSQSCQLKRNSKICKLTSNRSTPKSAP